MTGVIALAIEHIAKDLYCFNITQADINQTPHRLTHERGFSDFSDLSRRLDRCDRVIQNESSDPNAGNMCSFSGATCTSRVRHNASYVPCAQIRFAL